MGVTSRAILVRHSFTCLQQGAELRTISYSTLQGMSVTSFIHVLYAAILTFPQVNHVIANPTTSPAEHPSAHGSLNALPLLHRSPPSEASHPLGFFFQESDMDIPPPSPPTPTQAQPPHDEASFSNPLFSLQPLVANEQEERVEDSSRGDLNNSRTDDVRAGGLHFNGQATWSRAGPSGAEFNHSNGESSSSTPAMLPVVSPGPSAPSTMSVANYGTS